MTLTLCQKDVDDIQEWPDHWNHTDVEGLETTTLESDDNKTMGIIEFKGIAQKRCRDKTDCFHSRSGMECLEGQCKCADTMKVFEGSCKSATFCHSDSDCPHSWCDLNSNSCHEVVTLRILIVIMVLSVGLGVVFLMFFIHRRVKHKRFITEATARTGLMPQTPVTPACSLYCHPFTPTAPKLTATVIPVRI